MCGTTPTALNSFPYHHSRSKVLLNDTGANLGSRRHFSHHCKLKKRIAIKVVKRDMIPESAETSPTTLRQKHHPTATATVNNWIAESRQSRDDKESSSRRTIADWTSET
jgi:hypothetical protein